MGRGIEPGERQRLELALAEIDADLVRFATYTQHKSAWRIAATLANKGLTLMHLQRYEEGIAVCAEVVRLYGDRPDAPIQVLVAGALLQQGIAFSALGRLDEALLAYDALLRRFGDVGDNPDLAEVVATARQLRPSPPA
jgi:tetratricopeptide (TPR) repeat protein